MSETVISVENLSKKYRIRHRQRENYTTLRDVIANKFKGLNSISAPQAQEDFWALTDVSFEIKQGEVVGIIGRNGAGKTTLLKILSRITEPSEGRVRIKGRVASLLEVGTGFHAELTGRENIFLNGAILGMSRVEIKRKFDEIVAFAEVEKFLDTPVKRYSSGMYVRLAFAVAAHLEPEILIVDEVLAVGDSAFQKKCLGRIREVASSGRTVLFVSHNMNAVERICTRALLLDKGIVSQKSDDVRSVIMRYLTGNTGRGGSSSSWKNDGKAHDHPVIQPLLFAVVNQHGGPLTSPVRNDEPLFVVIRADVKQLDPALKVGFELFNEDSKLLFCSLTTDGPEAEWPRLERGTVELRCALPRRFLNEGSYRLELHCSLHCREWIIRPGQNCPAVHFEIQGGLSDSPYWTSPRPGLLAPEWVWERTFDTCFDRHCPPPPKPGLD